jgi:8-oxo-dGTP pyrophosphatase MutT (NUDIX family)
MLQTAPILTAALRHYAELCPAQANLAYAFASFAQVEAHAFERSNLAGHFTGSAWVVSADGQRTLLMHHRKLDRWLQPGGHADGDTDLARVALREACEETGVVGLRSEGGIFDIDRHPIPARGAEPAHWHHDVRYVVRAGVDERFVLNGESRALVWRPIADVAADETLEASLRRMARKWLASQ